MGVVVVGPSGSGKTILWKLLRTALGKLDQVVKQYTMNPKAMPRTQVYVLKFTWFYHITKRYFSTLPLNFG